MKYAAAFLALALIARNNLFFAGPFEVLRGLALVVAGGAGFLGVLQPQVLRALPKYWPQIGYLLSALLSLAVTEYTAYVGFQTLSLIAVVTFSIACSESKKKNEIFDSVLNVAFLVYALFLFLSLIVYVVKPGLVQEVLYGGEHRFRGVFPKTAIAGASSGVMVGLCLFWRNKPLLWRCLVLVPAATCLLLTQSRTFWVAAFVAAAVTYVIYFRQGIKIIAFLGIVLALLATAIYVADFRIKGDSFRKFARVESITNLTGRVELWKTASEKINRSPVLGLGLTAGSSAFVNQNNKMNFGEQDEFNESRGMGATTMHNGYIQSLLDLGYLGTFFYVTLVFSSLWRVYRRDNGRKYSVQFYLLIFLSVANFSENVIYAVTVFNSVLFFMMAGFARQLENEKTKPEKRARPVAIWFPQRAAI